MSVYEIFSSKQPHESSNLDAKLRKYLQRFLPDHLKDKPKEYVQKGKSIYSIRRIMKRYPNKEKIKQRLKEELMRGHRRRGRPPRQRRWTSVRRDEYLQEAKEELRNELREELKNKSNNQTTQSTSNNAPPSSPPPSPLPSPPPSSPPSPLPQQEKEKQTKTVTPPPSPKTTEHDQPAIPPEEIEKASKMGEEEEEEEDTDAEIDAIREFIGGFPSIRRKRKKFLTEMDEDEEDPEDYLKHNMFIADDD